MKKSLFVILLLFFLFEGIAFAWDGVPIRQEKEQVALLAVITPSYTVVSPPTAYCTGATTCTSPNPGECSLACEDFAGGTSCYSGYDSNCRATFNYLYTDGTPTIDFTTAHSGTFSCNDKGSNALQITRGAGDIAAIRRDFSGTDIYVQFYFNIVSESTSANQSIAIIGINGPSSIFVNVQNVSGTLKLVSTAGTGSTALSTNTWYRVGIAAKQSDDTFTVYLNGSSEMTMATYTDATAVTGISLGSWNFSAAEAASVVQFDNIAADASALPLACN